MQRPIVEKFLDARSEALSKETSTECPYAILGITKDAEPSQVRSNFPPFDFVDSDKAIPFLGSFCLSLNGSQLSSR